MNKLKYLFQDPVTAIYFAFPMIPILIILIMTPLTFMIDIQTVIKTGFVETNLSFSTIGACGFFIGLSLLIPKLRKMYKVLPWLFSFVKIFYVNFVILSIGSVIMNKGYEIGDSSRHTMFFIFMAAEVVICRIAMCIYFKKKPVIYDGER